MSADVSKKEQVDEAFSEISNRFGGKPLDILVNNAGYYTGVRPFGTETLEEWQSAFEVNLKGVYNFTTAFIANATSDATLINISSALAHTVPARGYLSYIATKLAGAGLKQCIQHEEPLLHIVNMHPGQVVETEMANKYAPNLPHVDDGMIPLKFQSEKYN